MVEQTQSYNPNTKELTVNVPAHSDREAITVIYGETSMVTSYTAYCIMGDTPADFDTSTYNNPQSESPAPLDSSNVESVFIFNVVGEGEMTDDEKENLPESFKSLCGSKPVFNSSKVIVDEATFLQSNFFNNSLLESAELSGSSRSKRQVNPRDEVKSVIHIQTIFLIYIYVFRLVAQEREVAVTSLGEILMEKKLPTSIPSMQQLHA